MLTKIIKQDLIDHFERWFDRAENIVLVSHVSPDGDAIGSTLGLWHFFNSQGKKATVIVPNNFPEFLKWLPGAREILCYDKRKEQADELIDKADIICCLDFNASKRVDNMQEKLLSTNTRKIMIDHHLYPEDFCKITISHPEICSTSELVFRLICRMGYWESLSYECAQCIYTGMMTDTGGFTYNSNNPEIYFIISQLLSKGIDKDDIYRKVFNNQSESRMRMMGFMLCNRMAVYHDFASALITLSREDMRGFNPQKGDTEGFVNIPLSIKGICFSVFLREDENMIKVSLRSTGDFPCNKVAEEFFNGGGHKNASGGEFYGKMEDAVALIKQAMVKYQDLLLKNR